MQTRSMRSKSGSNLQTASENAVNEDNDRAVLNAKPNPLFIPEMTHHIFHFLKLSDVKNCRLVCQQWNQMAETFQEKLSIVKIKPKQVGRFLETFPNAQQCKVFTRFVLGDKRSQCILWPHSRFVAFFEKWCQNLRELTLFAGAYGRGNYDLTPHLPSSLSKLEIQTGDQQRIISIDKICNIRVLYLQGCSIDITPGVILNHQEIELSDVKFLKHGLEIPNVLINPLLNFAVLKKVYFYNGENITLDLQGSHSLDVLSLDDSVTVLNWETSMWEMKKKLVIWSVAVRGEIIELGNVHMNYTNLELRAKHLDVSLLPEGIQKLLLDLHGSDLVDPQIDGQHKFPCLTKLLLHVPPENNFSPLVQHFKHCSNLTFLSVGSYCSSFLSTSSLPPSLKILRVNKVQIIVDQSLHLESLILHDYHWNCAQDSNIAEVAKGLHVKNLIWLRDCYTDIPDDQKIFDVERGNVVNNLIHLKFDNFVVGYFQPVEDYLFEESYFFPIVDKQGMNLFQHGTNGKAISQRAVKSFLKY